MNIKLDIKSYDRGLWLGDSKTQGDTYGSVSPAPTIAPVIKWHYYLAQQINDHFISANKPVPVHITSGVAGDTVGAIVAGLSNRCYQWCPDWVVIEVTTNDITNAIPNATYLTNLNGLLNGIQNPANYHTGRAPRWILFIGPNMIGENWPNGSNLFDTVPTGIDAKAAIYGPTCAALGVVSWNPRAAVLAWETNNNPTHAPSGLLSTALDGPTGKHELQLGAQAMASWIMENKFQGIPAGLPQFPMFTISP